MLGDREKILTKTPILVLFIVLISVGVGTASALITITLAGDVHITGDTTIDGELSIGTDNPNDNDVIRFDDGSENLTWDESISQFTFSDSLNIDDEGSSLGDGIFFGGVGNIRYLRGSESFFVSHKLNINGPIHIAETNVFPIAPYNIMGFGVSNSGLDSVKDLLVVDDLEVGGKIFADDNLTVDGTIRATTSGTPAIFDRTGSDGPLVIFDKAGVGKGTISISGETVSYNAFTGSHYAWTGEEMKRGLLVSMNGDNKYLYDNPNNEILYGVEISQTKNDSAILGTYLSVLDTSVVASLDNPLLITSEGNGKVWVAYTGEEIKPGDYLISSAVSGHAMKDDRAEEVSHIIGRAAEHTRKFQFCLILYL